MVTNRQGIYTKTYVKSQTLRQVHLTRPDFFLCTLSPGPVPLGEELGIAHSPPAHPISDGVTLLPWAEGGGHVAVPAVGLFLPLHTL